MSEDIEHRACFDLPSPGSIIETHYGTEHALDAAFYLHAGMLNESKIPDGKYIVYTGGIQAGKSFARRVFEKNTIKDYKPKI